MTRQFAYPVELENDDDGSVLVRFPDLPGALTFGEDKADALARAVDALETLLAGYIADRLDIPNPSRQRGRLTVSPTLLGTLKLSIYITMRERDWRKADLARALGQNPRQIDRLLDPRHGSTVAQLEQALAVCGKRAEVAVMDVAA